MKPRIAHATEAEELTMKTVKAAPDKRSLSLAPLSFDEAVTDILTIKPEPKAPKKKLRAKKQASK